MIYCWRLITLRCGRTSLVGRFKWIGFFDSGRQLKLHQVSKLVVQHSLNIAPDTDQTPPWSDVRLRHDGSWLSLIARWFCGFGIAVRDPFFIASNNLFSFFVIFSHNFCKNVRIVLLKINVLLRKSIGTMIILTFFHCENVFLWQMEPGNIQVTAIYIHTHLKFRAVCRRQIIGTTGSNRDISNQEKKVILFINSYENFSIYVSKTERKCFDVNH